MPTLPRPPNVEIRDTDTPKGCGVHWIGRLPGAVRARVMLAWLLDWQCENLSKCMIINDLSYSLTTDALAGALDPCGARSY
jgi:hypothetical protein